MWCRNETTPIRLRRNLCATATSLAFSRTTAAGPAFYGYDGNGNVTLLTNAAGGDVGHYRYDAFGNTLEATGSRAGENPYRFSTKEWHGPSGLYDYGFRFYSPGMGRWMNRDPLQEEGGVNLYAMVGNNPINDVDEYGLQGQTGNPYCDDGITGTCGPATPKPAPAPINATTVILTSPFTGKDEYIPHDSTGDSLLMPTGVNIKRNIAAAKSHFGNVFWLKSQVQNKGPWDYKQRGSIYQDFGNFNYGVVGRAMGITRKRLLNQAGVAQIKAGTSRPEWGWPANVSGFGGKAPYGDDPTDQMMITRGMDWYDAYASAQSRNYYGLDFRGGRAY